MTTPEPQPPLASFLQELEARLGGLAPAERTDVLNGIRQHVAAKVGDQPSDDEVREALRQLGTPESIADAAYAERAEPSDPRQAIAPGNDSALAEAWVPVGVGLFGLVALVALAVMSVTLASVGPGRWIAFSWLVILLVVSMSPLWSRREKAVLIALVPVAWVLVAVPARFGGRLAAVPAGVVAVALFAMVLPRLVQRGRSRV